MRPRTVFRNRAAVAALATLALALTACASEGDSDSDSKGSSSATVNPEAEAAVKKYSAYPTNFGFSEPLKSKPPAGKTIAVLTSGAETDAAVVAGIKEAAAALDWKVLTIQGELGPEGINNGMKQAIAQRPDVINVGGASPTDNAVGFAAAKEAGIPVVAGAFSATPESVESLGIIGVVNGPKQVERNGQLMADWAAVDSSGKSFDTAFVNFAALQVLAPLSEGYSKELDEVCDGCGVTGIDAQLADIGTKIPTQVVAAVRANPKIKYVVVPFSNVAVGLAPALKTAGFGDVKVIGQAPSGSSFAALRDGTNAMWIASSYNLWGWRVVDQAARYFTDTPVLPASNAEFDYTLYTKDNVSPEQVKDFVAADAASLKESGITDEILKLWQVAP